MKVRQYKSLFLWRFVFYALLRLCVKVTHFLVFVCFFFVTFSPLLLNNKLLMHTLMLLIKLFLGASAAFVVLFYLKHLKISAEFCMNFSANFHPKFNLIAFCICFNKFSARCCVFARFFCYDFLFLISLCS